MFELEYAGFDILLILISNDLDLAPPSRPAAAEYTWRTAGPATAEHTEQAVVLRQLASVAFLPDADGKDVGLL